MGNEIKRIQNLQIEQEKQGQQPEQLPTEAELRDRISQMRTRCIKQWKEDKFDEFVHNMRKR